MVLPDNSRILNPKDIPCNNFVSAQVSTFFHLLALDTPSRASSCVSGFAP